MIVPSYSSDVPPVINLTEFDSDNPCAWSEDLVLPDHSEAFPADMPVDYTIQQDLSRFLAIEQLADEASEPGLSPSSVGFPLDDYDTLDDVSLTLEPTVTCVVPQLGGYDQADAEPLAQWQIVSPTDEELLRLRINTRAASLQTPPNIEGCLLSVWQTSQVQHHSAGLEPLAGGHMAMSIHNKKHRFQCRYHKLNRKGRRERCKQKFERLEHFVRHLNANVHADVKSMPKGFCYVPSCMDGVGRPKGFTRYDNAVDHILTHLHVVKEDNRVAEKRVVLYIQGLLEELQPEATFECLCHVASCVIQEGKVKKFSHCEDAMAQALKHLNVNNERRKPVEKRSVFVDPDVLFAGIWEGDPERAERIVGAIIRRTQHAIHKPAVVEAWLIKHGHRVYVPRPVRKAAEMFPIAKL